MFKRSTPLLCASLAIASLNSCQDTPQQATSAKLGPIKATDTARVNGTPCEISFSGIRFTKSINGADTLAKGHGDEKIVFRVGEKKDYFSDPDGKLSNKTAPILLTEIDNQKPFTFIAKVSPKFTPQGLYNAGVLYLYVNDSFYQKFCFEQDERGHHRMVSVRTMGTSDDNNHDVVAKPFVYMKISSDTSTVASYYSTDKKTWQMVRLYQNNYPEKLWVGISAQCPQDKGTTSDFEEISLSQSRVKDFRLGE